MDKINKLIHKYTDNNPQEAEAMRDQEEALNAAMAAMAIVKLQHKLHLNQSQFSKLVGVPHSTISRIENGDVNPSSQLLRKIAYRTHKHLKIQFV